MGLTDLALFGIGRRGLLKGGLASLLVSASPSATLAQTSIGIVSRERILRETAQAQALRNAELALSEMLQTWIDDAKGVLAAEEAELARLRSEISAVEFAERAESFDQRVRAVRQKTQGTAAQFQRGFQEARAEIVRALPPLLEQLRVEAGVEVILNSDQVLAQDSAVDLTDRAIALFNSEGPWPKPPEIDLSVPLVQPPADGTGDGAETQQ